MTPFTFNAWLDAMKTAGLATSDASCARLLGVTTNTLVRFKREGTDHRTALACNALLRGIGAFSVAQVA